METSLRVIAEVVDERYGCEAIVDEEGIHFGIQFEIGVIWVDVFFLQDDSATCTVIRIQFFNLDEKKPINFQDQISEGFLETYIILRGAIEWGELFLGSKGSPNRNMFLFRKDIIHLPIEIEDERIEVVSFLLDALISEAGKIFPVLLMMKDGVHFSEREIDTLLNDQGGKC